MKLKCQEVAMSSQFSKTAGFTGTRCAFMVIPKNLVAATSDGEQKLASALVQKTHHKIQRSILSLQKAAAAIYTPKEKRGEGYSWYYMNNAKTLRESLDKLGFQVYEEKCPLCMG